MTFSQSVWTAIRPVMEAIEAQPFVKQLGDGALDRQRFTYYMAQDALYLADYGRALAAAAAQAREPDDLIFWAGAAREAIVVERQLHGSHVTDLSAAEPSPTCSAYTQHLLALSAAGSYPVLVAGLLPCFWIYSEVGDHLLGTAGPLERHPYGDWIGTYADPAFTESTRTAITIMDRLAEESAPLDRRRMHAAFTRSAQYEWMFWDAAHRMETWPVAAQAC